jgi:predicted nucleic acid-binding protein
VIPIVVDTNVLLGALWREGGASRGVIKGCLSGRFEPLIGVALFCEYEDLFGRTGLFASCPLDPRERREVLTGFLSVCRWTHVYFAWRPNLPDEGDNHLFELALAGGASAIVTRNLRDLKRGELRFPSLRILTPEQFLEEEGDNSDYPNPR